MSALQLVFCLLGSFCLTNYVSGAITCYDCDNNAETSTGCVRFTSDPLTDATCNQCKTVTTYSSGAVTNVERACEGLYPNKEDNVYVKTSTTETVRCTGEKCNNVQTAYMTCHACTWTRDSGDKDFCRTGSGIPSSLEVEKCYSCKHTETYDADGLASVTRGCGNPADEIGCVKNGADYTCTCHSAAKCNNQAVETRTCQICDWYHERSDHSDCRYGEDNTTHAECFQCETVETFADDDLMSVERGCALPGLEDAENCDEADNVGTSVYPAAIVSSRTCLCKDRDSCNDVSGAGVISSSLAILVSSILILAM